jgi:FkbM family methyltransferase
MTDEIELRDGWWWPKADTEAWVAIRGEVGDIDEIMKHVKGLDCVIQAGGNCGMWPKRYASLFKEVHTFEPDATNLECLTRNVKETNVKIWPYAVGDRKNHVSMEVRWDVNRGANRIALSGDIPMVPIDKLFVDACDLIQLDVEGFEHQAVLGAREMIAKYKPVVVLELKGHGEHYGHTDRQTIELMESLGYSLARVIRTDHIFVSS